MEDFDFIVDGKVWPKRWPVTMSEAVGETPPQRFERYVRQVSRCVQACSLCERGWERNCKFGNVFHDPHRPPSLWHSKVAMIKYQPEESDYNSRFGLFGGIKPIFDAIGLDFDSVYRTALIKCAPDGENKYVGCPYLELELKALLPQLIIFVDTAGQDLARHFGLLDDGDSGQSYEPGKFIRLRPYAHELETRAFVAETPEQLRAVLKLVKAAQSDPQISSRLFV